MPTPPLPSHTGARHIHASVWGLPPGTVRGNAWDSERQFPRTQKTGREERALLSSSSVRHSQQTGNEGRRDWKWPQDVVSLLCFVLGYDDKSRGKCWCRTTVFSGDNHRERDRSADYRRAFSHTVLAYLLLDLISMYRVDWVILM